MTPPAPPSPAPRPYRRFAWALAGAIPALLIALLGSCVLIRFLAARDALGPWTLTIHDRHGTVVGHGRLTLAADAWTAHWSTHAPYLTFTPNVRSEAGTLAVTDWRFWDAEDPHHPDFGRTTFTLHVAMIFNDQFYLISMEPCPDQKTYLVIPVDPDRGDITWNSTIGHGHAGTVPCTITRTRDR